MRAYERLLKYVVVPTASAEDVEASPTTERQFALAHMLTEELRGLGVVDACCSDSCYVYAHLPATPGCEGAPRLGFIAHMDTVADFPGEGVKPRVIENYSGGDVELGCGRTLRVSDFPHLSTLAGRTLITASGDTLLGADDKAGIAEIMTLVERLAGEEHGPISIAFTPDEEVGRGTADFDLERFGADFAYTVDGGPEGELSYENFNAASAVVKIRGLSVHTGSAKDVMINAALLAKCDLRKQNFSGCVLRRLNAMEADFSEADFSGARLEGCVFAKALFAKTDMRKTTASRCQFDEARMMQADARIKAEAEARTAVDDMARLRRSMAAYDVPLMRRTLSLLRTAVENGELSVTDYYVEAAGVYRNMQAYIDLERQYHGAVAELTKNSL